MNVIQGEKKVIVTNKVSTFHSLDLQALIFPLCINIFKRKGMMTR